ncbi:MAG: hypothetical protein FWG70_05855 [Oscillospiraceae bacterium]|nr:hypothetical protein [Oscillospiraceae bacterium]
MKNIFCKGLCLIIAGVMLAGCEGDIPIQSAVENGASEIIETSANIEFEYINEESMEKVEGKKEADTTQTTTEDLYENKTQIKDIANNLLLNGFEKAHVITENRIIARMTHDYEGDDNERWMHTETWIFDGEGNVVSDGKWVDIRFGRHDEGRETIGIGIIYRPDGEEGIGEFLINQDGEKISPIRYDNITMHWLYNTFVVTIDGESYAVDGNGNRVDIEFD